MGHFHLAYTLIFFVSSNSGHVFFSNLERMFRSDVIEIEGEMTSSDSEDARMVKTAHSTNDDTDLLDG